MDAYTSFIISKSGEVTRMPILVIYADRFWNARGQRLALPSRPVPLEFNEELAKQPDVWTLGERMRVGGRVAGVDTAAASQQKLIQETRKQIAAADRSKLKAFNNGLYTLEQKLERLAGLRQTYLNGEISLDTLQNQENRLLYRHGHPYLEQLAVMHDKQLAMRRAALPALLAKSHVTYLIAAPKLLSHDVQGRQRFEKGGQEQTAGGQRVSTMFTVTSLTPATEKKLTRTAAGREQLLLPLRRFRQLWLHNGRPLDMLPPPSKYDPEMAKLQAAWLAFEAARAEGPAKP
ncbi:hypothetical protein ACFQ3L_04200 [Lacticaseibacillus jixianensis]|uniref:Uncharacterized protein n=1 Tax=Lacticaseibacillus jixianensis TaxID=2486012 RepID=A0ABW4B6Y3_9LACO|nr:hypothetical protein [Lacticaseibacillus jixianensis]